MKQYERIGQIIKAIGNELADLQEELANIDFGEEYDSIANFFEAVSQAHDEFLNKVNFHNNKN